MLTLVEGRSQKVSAMAQVRRRLQEGWESRETREVTWRPGSRTMKIVHSGELWFASLNPNPEETNPRYWNPFGAYVPDGRLRIAIEINIAVESNTGIVSGFFAKDPQTGAVYLLHDGGIGGGQTGVTKAAFLAWSGEKPQPVVTSDNSVRVGVIVAPVDSDTTAAAIARFVRLAIRFRQAVRDGETKTSAASKAQETYQNYFDEFSGIKRRRRLKEVEYESRHGDIVRALRDWRQSSLRSGQRIVKDVYIDLGVEEDGALVELYEVKSSGSRSNLYGAVGQITVHDQSPIGRCQRFLVLPHGDQVPTDIDDCLGRNLMSVIRFSIQGDIVSIHALRE